MFSLQELLVKDVEALATKSTAGAKQEGKDAASAAAVEAHEAAATAPQ